MLYTAVALRKLHGICSTRSTALLRHPANASFVQKIFHITECERKTNVQHHTQVDDLWACFKVPEWGVFCHTARLRDRPARLKLVLSDSAMDQALVCKNDMTQLTPQNILGWASIV